MLAACSGPPQIHAYLVVDSKKAGLKRVAPLMTAASTQGGSLHGWWNAWRGGAGSLTRERGPVTSGKALAGAAVASYAAF